MSEFETVPCKICGEPTEYTASQLCLGCWEVDRELKHFLSFPAGCRRVMELLREAIEEMKERR